jgi:hypothetical protein
MWRTREKMRAGFWSSDIKERANLKDLVLDIGKYIEKYKHQLNIPSIRLFAIPDRISGLKNGKMVFKSAQRKYLLTSVFCFIEDFLSND